MSEDVAKRVKQYVDVRDTIKRVEERHKAELAPLVEIQQRLQGILEAALDSANAESLRTANGTCYKSTRYSASLADPEAFMNYVIANNAFHLLDRRANATAVQDYVKEHHELPPGCNLNGIRSVGVRRAPGS